MELKHRFRQDVADIRERIVIRPPNRHSTNGPQSLGPRQHHHLAAVVSSFVPNRSVELHYDVHGVATIAILPASSTGSVVPTLIIQTGGSAFHLGVLHADAYRKISEHHNWDDVLSAIRIIITWEMPFPTTLH
jgi:hypothetical protein